MSAPSDDLLQRVKKENEELHFELKDLQYLIQLKEEELVSLKESVTKIAELQSRLDANIYEIEQMRHQLEATQHQASGALKREQSLEEELTQNVSIEKSYYDLKDKYTTTQSALEDVYKEMDEAVKVYKDIAQLNSRIAELESSLELVQMDNQFLNEELRKYRILSSEHNQPSK
jgi:hypothetical protein